MLVELRIRNYAVIDDLTLELGPGLNVLSGETGAGKSIIVGALTLLLGGRASAEDVRAGAEEAWVEAVFDLETLPEVEAKLAEQGLPQEDGLILLRRQVQRAGRNRAWVNGSPATAGAVGDLGRSLVDLHGQHEHQTLLRPQEQRRILDAYAGLTELAHQVTEAHARAQSLRKERDERLQRRRELQEREDFLRFQLKEIDEAELREDEPAELEAEASRLEHAEELAEGAQEAHWSLYGQDGAVSERLDEARRRIQDLARKDPSLEATAGTLEEAYHQVVEASRTLGDYAGGVEHDPGRLEEVRARLDRVSRLLNKYGTTVKDVLERGEELRSELDELERAELDLDSLEREIQKAEEELGEKARRLSEGRQEAGKELAKELEAILPSLGLADAVFQVRMEPLEEPGPGGSEQVFFEASLNPGFAPRALARVASGGELSRIMLALKATLARVDRVPTLIFDEIDSGVGGEVAKGVAAKLREVAEAHQVFVITHLPQLAASGHRHYRVDKAERDGRAAVEVGSVTGEDRVREVARMLGGDPDSTASQEHAQELLDAGAGVTGG